MLGHFEFKVLRSIEGLHDGAYGVAIRKHINDEFSKDPSYGALYTTLSRLEKKGYVRSKMGKPGKVRGGRAKKFYLLTAEGHRELHDFKSHIQSLISLSGGGAYA